MAVYGADDPVFLNEALTSIWTKQNLRPNEIILIVDGPINGSLQKLIEDWKLKIPDALQLKFLKENRGLAKALNIGLALCRHEIVARMDADDISLPNRFEIQVKYLIDNPHLTCCGARAELFDDKSTRTTTKVMPEHHHQIFGCAKFRNPIIHPTSAFRKSAILEVGGYPDFRTSQDYALWSVLLSKGYIFENLPIVLLQMRAGDALLKRRGLKYFYREIKVLLFQYKISFTSLWQTIRNIFIRLIVRLVPVPIRKYIYKLIK